MTDTRTITGRCLCGAVTASATITNPILRACHCDMCRQHTSGMFVSLAVDEGSVDMQGDVCTYRSSDWAQRGFCGTCGSTLFYETVHDGARHPAAGLFADIDDVPLKLEFFSDMCPSGYALAGDHRRLTTQQTIAIFTSPKGVET